MSGSGLSEFSEPSSYSEGENLRKGKGRKRPTARASESRTSGRERDNGCCVWDFTHPCDGTNVEWENMKKAMNEECKKWCFQLEKSINDYMHYQGRVSFKVKKRLSGAKKVFGDATHWSQTSKANKDNFYYVEKSETRFAGPWKSDDEPIELPRQLKVIEEKGFMPWQKTVYDSIMYTWDSRTVNVIIDFAGNKGKGTFVLYLHAKKIAARIPPFKDLKDMSRAVMRLSKRKCYFIDIPRALDSRKMTEMWAGIETIKDGLVYDDRYKYEETMMDSPHIWVFMNSMPNEHCLSRDRWRYWSINQNLQLVPYERPPAYPY